MKQFLHQPIRQLSLGQKMRANIAVALLHDPSTLYLDEPTIGLDVIAKSRIRSFIRELNKEKNTTVILTTHDMDDIEQICDRLIMIDMGQIIYDGTLDSFKSSYSGEMMITVVFSDQDEKILDDRFHLLRKKGPEYTFLVKKDDISVGEAVSLITRKYNIADIRITEPEIEEIVKDIYTKVI